MLLSKFHLLLICLFPICFSASPPTDPTEIGSQPAAVHGHTAAGNLTSQLDDQLSTANFETEKARISTDRAKLDRDRAQLLAMNISMQINATKLQQRITELERERAQLAMNISIQINATKMQQRITDLETDLAKQNGQEQRPTTNNVLYRNETIHHVAVDQHLVASRLYWSIQAGGLKAKMDDNSWGWAHVRADEPFPVARVRSEDKMLFYFEVTFTGNSSNVDIGLCGADFPFTSYIWEGRTAGSFFISKDGKYLASGKSHLGFIKGGFNNGDVVGCGLLVLSNERRLFFTKNGEIWMKPILLGAEEAKANLYPIVSAFISNTTTVEFNFGADLAAKPFKSALSQLNMERPMALSVLFRNETIRHVTGNRRLVTSGRWSIQAGGLKANITTDYVSSAHVHANQPFLVAFTNPKALYYFEVTFTRMVYRYDRDYIGLCDDNFPFTSSDAWVGGAAGSFAMRMDGTYWASSTYKSGLTNGPFREWDTVGCGLLVLPTERRLFFTKNGEIWMKPILLGAKEAKVNLYPIVSSYGDVAVEFNFGTNLAAKPFTLSHLSIVD